MSGPMNSPSGLTRQTANQSQINVRFVLNAARRWWKVAAPIGLAIGALAASVVYLRFEPSYEARYRLQINQDYIVFPREQQPAIDFIRTQGELICSPLVMQPVIENSEIMAVPEIAEADDPIVHLMETVKVKPVGGAQLFDVTYAAANPDHAAIVVNEVVKSYFDLRNDQDEDRMRSVTDVLQNALGNWKLTVETAENKVRSLAANAPEAPAAGAATVRPDPEADLRVQVVLAEAEAEELKVLEENLQQPPSDEAIAGYLVEEAVERNALVQDLSARLNGMKAEIREMESKGKPPSFGGYQQQLVNTQQQLDDLREDVRKQIREDFKSQLYFRQADELAQIRQRHASLQARIDYMRQQLAAQETESDEGAKKDQVNAVELELARNELERATEIHELIAARIMRIETEKPMSPVRKLMSAVPPTVPVEEAPFKNLALAALGGLLMPFGLAVLWELRARRISDSRQFEEHSNLEVIGEIAMMPARTFSSRLQSRKFQRGVRLFEESVDSLSTFLVLAEPHRDVRALAVCSAESGEGKTSVASKLAISVAQATNAVTLLIDGDLRSPDLHTVFGVDLKPGLAGVLAGEATLDEAIVKLEGTNIHLLPAGRLRGQAHRLFGNGALKNVLDEARSRYGYVIVDTPPILPASETLLLASLVDAALMCVMQDRSTVDRVSRANARLTGAGVRVLGAVINGVPTTQYARTYGDYAYQR